MRETNEPMNMDLVDAHDGPLPRPAEVQQTKEQKKARRKRENRRKRAAVDPAYAEETRTKQRVRKRKSRNQGEESTPPLVDWQKAVAENGHTYYYNLSTGRSQWNRPPDYTSESGGMDEA